MLKVTNILNDETTPYLSVAKIELNGTNHLVVNHECDAEYNIIKGTGIFVVDDKKIVVKAGDKITIPKNTPYRDSGKMTMICICRPRFTLEQSVVIED